jgi:hypothetical protein
MDCTPDAFWRNPTTGWNREDCVKSVFSHPISVLDVEHQRNSYEC